MEMIGNKCLLDTSVVIHFFKNDLNIVRLLNSFTEICVNSTVSGELYYGAFASSNPQKHINQVQSFLSNCNFIQVGIETSEIYGRLKSDLKRKGTPIPENDIWIAASSVEHDIPLFTTDKHFELMKLDLIKL
jgi:tRNA(fMet)-specific endonuclease VapC